MRVFSLIVLITCFCNSLFSQVDIKGVVINAQTNDPVPYVNIGVRNASIGTVSGPDGNFELRLRDKKEVVTFSSIGYEVVNFSGAELVGIAQIQLVPKDYQIAEVEVVASKFEGADKIFGVKNKTRGLSIGFGSRNLGTEIGAAIQIKEPVFIKHANFVLNHAGGDSLLFRVNIRDYQEGKPGPKLLKEDVFIHTKQKRGVISIDLTPYDLVLEADVLLSLEWIKDDKGKGNADITFDTKKAKSLKGVLVKKNSIGEFETMGYVNRKLKPCFYLIGKRIKD